MRAHVKGVPDEWEPEMHSNETATESAWNANESSDAWEQASSGFGRAIERACPHPFEGADEGNGLRKPSIFLFLLPQGVH